MDIPSLLKKHRDMLKLTQQQVADSLYVSRNTYTQYENGNRKIDTETFFKLVEILDINMTVKEYLNSEIRARELNEKHKEWEDLRDDFFQAISNNDLNSVRWYIENGMQIETKNKDDDRAFIFAVGNNAHDVVDYLLKEGAIYHIEDEYDYNMSSLSVACVNEFKETVEVLLKNGIDPNETIDVEGEVLSCLWIASRFKNKEIFKLLIGYGADINFRMDIPNNPDPLAMRNIFVDMFVHFMRECMLEGRNSLEFTEEQKDMLLFIKEEYESMLDQDNLETINSYIKDFFR